MAKKKYILNPDTLVYELQRIPLFKRFSKGMMYFLLSLLLFAGYYFLYIKVFKFETPKTMALKQQVAEISSKMEVLRSHMEESREALAELQARDNNVYRPAFGMEPLVAEASDFQIVNLREAMSELYEMVYTRSISFDTVAPIAKGAGLMAGCVPSIPPVFLNHIRLTSRFGVRADPLNGDTKVHTGIDLAGNKGEAVYATGDGTVEQVQYNFFGYGHEIVVNHGFGYKTRYAHLQQAFVRPRDVVIRGQQIATLGNSGRSTGPHLHYEVIYMGRKMNPLNFFNQNITPQEYERLVSGK